MREDSLLNPTIETDEEITLRPKRLDEFIGQDRVRERLEISLDAARKEKRPLDHVLLSGPPGLGKTTLAGIIANELDVKIRITSGPALDRPGDLAAILSNLDTGDVFFIDEIHRLPRAVEEVLYPAMEDFQLDIVLGKGPSAQSIRLDLPQFTLVGATTRKGKVTAPLRDRFGIEDKLDYYPPDELAVILRRSAGILDVKIAEDAAGIIAHRSRGTPRIANRLLARVRDYAVARASGSSTPTSPTRHCGCSKSTTWASTRSIGPSSRRSSSSSGRSGRALHSGDRRRRGAGDGRGRLRAVPAPDRSDQAHPPRPHGHRSAYRHLGQEPPADPQGTLL